MSFFQIRVKVTGGTTGTRESLLKRNGKVRYFETYDEAERAAEEYRREMNTPHAKANFYATVEEAK